MSILTRLRVSFGARLSLSRTGLRGRGLSRLVPGLSKRTLYWILFLLAVVLVILLGFTLGVLLAILFA